MHVLGHALDLRGKAAAIRQHKQPRRGFFRHAVMLKFDLTPSSAGFQTSDLRAGQIVDIALLHRLMHGAKHVMVVHYIAQRRHADVGSSQYGSAKPAAIGNVNGRNRRDFRQCLPYAQALQNEAAAMGQCQRTGIFRFSRQSPCLQQQHGYIAAAQSQRQRHAHRAATDNDKVVIVMMGRPSYLFQDASRPAPDSLR